MFNNTEEITALIEKIGNLQLPGLVAKLDNEISDLSNKQKKLEQAIRVMDISEGNSRDRIVSGFTDSGESLFKYCCAKCLMTSGAIVHLRGSVNGDRRNTFFCPECLSSFNLC